MFYFKSKNKFDLLSSAESQIGKIVKLRLAEKYTFMSNFHQL